MTVAHFTTMMTLAAVLAIPAAPAAQAAKAAPTQPAKTAPTQTTKSAPAPPAKAPAGRGTAAAAAPALTPAAKAKLKNPAALKDVAPAEFRASFDTSAGPFVILVHRSWAPKGADRFYNLVKYGYFNNARFFRVLPGFMVQFGLNGDPEIQGPWENANIPDDPVTQHNTRGMVTFAMTSRPNTRSTQVFINFADNSRLDRSGFAPFGEVVTGMPAVDKINAEYREEPDQELITNQGNPYLAKQFPRLDYVRKATIVATPATPTTAAAKAKK